MKVDNSKPQLVCPKCMNSFKPFILRHGNDLLIQNTQIDDETFVIEAPIPGPIGFSFQWQELAYLKCTSCNYEAYAKEFIQTKKVER